MTRRGKMMTVSTELDDPRFTPWASGRFMARFGPRGAQSAPSAMKLCLVASDAPFLIDFLYGLSLREDCFAVKYGTIARDGMYLGRCNLQTDRATAELCQELKGHPRLMVTLQDDDFFREFREPPVPEHSFGVWDEWPEHVAAVSEVHERAFGRADEAAMVDAARRARWATISLVAGKPPRDRQRDPWPIVGHVLLSPVTIEGKADPRGLGIAPLAVLPEHQRQGIGTRLVHAALRRAKALGYAYIVVLGHPPYYPRFGFVPASRFSLRYQRQVSDEAFMALELTPGSLDGASGVVRYVASF